MTRQRFQDWLMVTAPRGFAPSLRVWGDGASTISPDLGDLRPRLDVDGRSILDVGCESGAFALECLRRGARRVLGIDSNPDRIRMARSYASLAELPARFEVMDAEERLPEGRYDLVYCSTLSSAANPVRLVAKLARLADQELVLEFDGPQSPSAAGLLQRIGAPRPRFGKHAWPPLVLAQLRGREAHSFLAPSAVETMLLRRSARFAGVEVTPIGPGRFRAVARRRVISRLVIVAAAGRVETERLVNRIRTGEAPPEVLERLKGAPGRRWVYAPNGVLAPSEDRVTAGLVYGFDLHSGASPARSPAHDDLIDLLESAAQVTIITTWAQPEVLQERGRRRAGQASQKLRRLERHPFRVLGESLARLTGRALRAPPTRWTPSRLRRFVGRARAELNLERRIERVRRRVDRTQRDDRAYRQTEEHLLRYARWMDFCRHLDPDQHWVADTTTERWTVHDATEWGNLLVERARRAHHRTATR